MSDYNRQQRETIATVRNCLAALDGPARRALEESIAPYVEYRRETSRFQEEHLAALCTATCFSDRTSACCGREGILTFFADVVVNLLLSTEEEADRLLAALDGDRGGFNCVYLGREGCLWTMKPVSCEMFLCDHARESVLGADPGLEALWTDIREREHLFTKPVQPVLFDDLERFFIDRGLDSPLMYFHRSPGLLRLKAAHGVGRARTAPPSIDSTGRPLIEKARRKKTGDG
jgi:hypothetical protein